MDPATHRRIASGVKVIRREMPAVDAQYLLHWLPTIGTKRYLPPAQPQTSHDATHLVTKELQTHNSPTPMKEHERLLKSICKLQQQKHAVRAFVKRLREPDLHRRSQGYASHLQLSLLH